MAEHQVYAFRDSGQAFLACLACGHKMLMDGLEFDRINGFLADHRDCQG